MSASLVLHTSNRLEILADQLAEILAVPLDSPLTPEIVIVQSHGMERWLSQQLASAPQLGICANVDFCFPQRFFNSLAAEMLNEQPDTCLYERDAMAWAIMALLPRLIQRPEFTAVARYLKNDESALRSYQLAQRIAQVFDQYIVFRPRMILQWDVGDDDNWQAILWRELQALAPRQHQAALAQKLVAEFPRAKNLPERIAIFGVSTLPPLYVELFEQLAAAIPVHLFVMQPTPAWGGDVQSKRERQRARQPDLFEPERDDGEGKDHANPLLAENSKLGRDFLNLLFESGAIQHAEHFEKPSNDTVLGQIQRDIFDFEERQRKTKRVVPATDCSVQFHSCYSIVRELEVLQNQVLALFDRSPTLLPKDIVVMMPDVGIYAPFIDAVFGAPEKKEHFVPYSMADRVPRAASGITDSFLGLLEVLPGRFRVSEVLALLETPAMQRKFRIAPADLEKARTWSSKAGARWGIDAAHRVQLDLPAFADNSWRAALDRMLLGYAMQPRGVEVFGGVLPFDRIEGSDADVLGRFVDFLERLFARARAFAQSRSLATWQHDLLETLEEFFEGESSDERELSQLRIAIRRLQEISDVTQHSAAVPLAVIVKQLEKLLEEARRGAGFLNGTLTFCALKPMRSIPFRVVCLLGMNDTAYPRRQRALSFDLIAQHPKLGDRTMRADDRALFLEALLSAHDVFYVSYLGRSLRDNSELPPSVLVSELIDYVQSNFKTPPQGIVAQHPLQAFSAKNFNGADARVFSYSADNYMAAEIAARDRGEMLPLTSVPLPEPDQSAREVTLAQLEGFFGNPAKFFLRERLQVQLPSDEPALEDEEPFALGPLDRYDLGQILLDAVLRGDDPLGAFEGVRAQGILPPGELGLKFFVEAVEKARALGEAILLQIGAELGEALELSEILAPFTFSARIDEIRGGVLLRFRLAALKAKDFWRAWLRHLARNLVEKGETQLFGFDEEVEAYRFRALEARAARSALRDLLQIYWRGLGEPLRLFPESSFDFVNAIHRGEDVKEARAASDKGWFGNKQMERGGDRNDAFIALAFRSEEDPRNAEWQRVSREALAPLFEQLEKI